MSSGKLWSFWLALNVSAQHPCWVPDPPMKWVGTQFTNLWLQDLPAKYLQITWWWLILAAKIKIRRSDFDAMKLESPSEQYTKVRGILENWIDLLLTHALLTPINCLFAWRHFHYCTNHKIVIPSTHTLKKNNCSIYQLQI